MTSKRIYGVLMTVPTCILLCRRFRDGINASRARGESPVVQEPDIQVIEAIGEHLSALSADLACATQALEAVVAAYPTNHWTPPAYVRGAAEALSQIKKENNERHG